MKWFSLLTWCMFSKMWSLRLLWSHRRPHIIIISFLLTWSRARNIGYPRAASQKGLCRPRGCWRLPQDTRQLESLKCWMFVQVWLLLGHRVISSGATWRRESCSASALRRGSSSTHAQTAEDSRGSGDLLSDFNIQEPSVASPSFLYSLCGEQQCDGAVAAFDHWSSADL